MEGVKISKGGVGEDMEGDEGKGKGESDSQAVYVTARDRGEERGRRRQNRMRDKAPRDCFTQHVTHTVPTAVKYSIV